ncbi:MAG TPA: tandem-95 repeat protein, partial [Ramlibacter sp.]
GGAITGTLTATDTIDGMTTPAFTVTSNGSHGTATINATTGAWSYTPAADYNGPDSFTVRVTDNNGNFATQVITLNVTGVADIVADTASVNEDSNVITNLLTNDSFEGAETITAVTQGTNGTVTIIDPVAGTVRYTPNANFNGTDTYTYTVTSGGVSETATVTVTVTQVDDPTTFGGNTTGSGNEDNGAITGTLTATDASDGMTSPAFTVVGAAANGTATINAATGVWSYTPAADYNGADSFTVRVTDNNGNTATRVISLTVNPVADAVNNAISVAEDGNVTTAVRGNDSFEGASPLVTAVTQGANGTVSIVNAALGTVLYTPNANFHGTDTYTYTVTSGGVTETATVTVTVTPVDDPVTFGGNTTGSGNEDAAAITGTLTATDAADGMTTPAFTVVGNPAHGTAAINATTGAWSYTPAADYNGADSFTVRVTDNLGNTATRVITLAVAAQADITADTAITGQNVPVTINAVANDNFEAAPTITAINGSAITDGGAAVAVTNGSVALSGGNLVFTPTAGFSGTPTFTYTVGSGGVFETATVTVTVVATPTVSAVGSPSVTEGTALVYGVTLSHASPVATTYAYTIGGGSSTASGADYGAVSFTNGVTLSGGVLTVPANVTSFDVVVAGQQDLLDEAAETLRVSVGGVVGTGTLADDDAMPSLSIDSRVVDEAAGTVTFTVTLSAPSGQTVTVGYATADGSAGAADYTGATGTLTFAPGVVTQTITIAIAEDTIFESGGENFTVNLGSPTNASIATGSGTGTITDNDTAPTVTFIGSPSVNEGQDLVYTITMSNASSTSTDVTFGVGGTATAFTDYGVTPVFSNGVTLAGTTLTIPAGVTSFTVTVPTVQDTTDEPNETLVISSSGGITGTGTIVDDDAPPVLNINSVSVNEAAGTATFTVTLVGSTAQSVTVGYATGGGTATATTDYGVTSGTLTFAPGVTTQTITVSIVNDTAAEPSETFNVVLSGPTNATIGTATGVATIIDNDQPPTIDLDASGAGTGFATSYTENGTGISIADTDLAVGDVDSAQLTSATITLTNRQAGDLLSVSGTLPTGITASAYNAATGVLTLSGAATPAAYQAAIAAIRFSNTSDSPNTTARAITVTASDGNSSSAAATATITVLSVNDAPSGANNTLTTNEDTPRTFTTADFGFSDVDGHALNGVRITTLPAAGTGTITLNGVAVTAGQLIPVASITGNLLVFTPAANASGNGAASFTFQVQDSGGTANSGVDLDGTPNTIAFNVTAVNDAPVGVADAFSAAEGSTTSKTSVLANDTDVDGPAATAWQVATTAAGTIVPVNGTNVVATALGGTVVMNPNGTFTYTAPTRTHNDATPDIDSFVYRSSDGSANSGWVTVNLTITDTGPTATADTDTVARGSSTTGNVIAGTGGPTPDVIGADTAQITGITYNAVAVTPSGGTWTVNTGTGTLTISANGAYTYTSTAPGNLNVGTPAALTDWTNAVASYGFDGEEPYNTGTTVTSGINTGLLIPARAGEVRWNNPGGAGNDGIGVETDTTAANYDIQSGEELVLNLGRLSQSTTVSLTSLATGETAQWHAYAANGAWIASGTIAGDGDSVVTGTIAHATPFQYIVLTSTNASAYRINGMNVTAYTPPVSIGYTLTDADGTPSTSTLTINTTTTVTLATDTNSLSESGLPDGTLPVAGGPTTSGNLLDNDFGLSATAVINQVTVGATNYTAVGGVITATDAFGTLVVYTQAGGGRVAGDYTYTLNAATADPATDTRTFTYRVNDNATNYTSTLAIDVVDDAPSAISANAEVAEVAAADYNLVLMLDISASMDVNDGGGEVRAVGADGTASVTTRLAMAKAGLVALVEEYYDQGSSVTVKLGLFANGATMLNGGAVYASKDALITAINAITGNELPSSTQYDDGINAMRTAFGTTPPTGVTNISYFLSDGAPTDPAAANTAIAAYNTFATTYGIRSYAVGIGT